MRKGISTGPTICGICNRKKDAAIREQVKAGCDCGNIKCIFLREIRVALTEEKKTKIKIKILKPTKAILRIKILPPLNPKSHE